VRSQEVFSLNPNSIAVLAFNQQLDQPSDSEKPAQSQSLKVPEASFDILESDVNELTYLPLRISKGSDSPFNKEVKECLIVLPHDESASFLTNDANTSFIFTHLHEKQMLIEAIEENCSYQCL